MKSIDYITAVAIGAFVGAAVWIILLALADAWSFVNRAQAVSATSWPLWAGLVVWAAVTIAVLLLDKNLEGLQ